MNVEVFNLRVLRILLLELEHKAALGTSTESRRLPEHPKLIVKNKTVTQVLKYILRHFHFHFMILYGLLQFSSTCIWLL